MRIAQDARYIIEYFHGIGRYSYELLCALSEQDDHYEYVILRNPRHRSPIVTAPGFSDCPIRIPPVSPGTLLILQRVVRREGCDLLHSHFPVGPVLRSFPAVVTVHDLQAIRVEGFSGERPKWVEWAHRVFYRYAYRHTIQNADAIIAVSQATADELLDVYPGLRRSVIHVVHEAVDRNRFRPAPAGAIAALRDRLKLPERFILNVGNTRPHKNVPMLVRGFHEFLQQADSPDAALILAGVRDRFRPNVLALIEALGLQDRVRFVDYVSDEDLPVLYSAADFFAITSYKEGFGLPPLEAMSCGKAVVAARAASLPEIVGEAGLLVDPFDAQDIGAALARLWCDQDLRHELEMQAHVQAQKFSWERTAQQTIGVYHAILG